MLEGERDFLLLPHPLALLLEGDDLSVLEPALQVLLLHALLDLQALAGLGVLVVEEDGGVGLVADEVVLELVLVVPRDDLLVDGLRELGLVLLPALQALLQLVVTLLLAPDGLVLDELQRVLQVLEAVLDVEGLLRGEAGAAG